MSVVVIVQREYSGSWLEFVYSASGTKLSMTRSSDVIAQPWPTLPVDTVYHWYLTDNQGNISGVVNTATKELEQYQDYYPYGKPHDTAVDGSDNRRKFGGKELITDKGYDAYDFEARPLTLAIPRFTQPDIMAEKFYPISIYSYCAGDPINLIDPTCENWYRDNITFEVIWTDANSQEELNESVENGTFLTNLSGFTGANVSMGCLLLTPKDFSKFDTVMKGVKSFTIQITRYVPFLDKNNAKKYYIKRD